MTARDPQKILARFWSAYDRGDWTRAQDAAADFYDWQREAGFDPRSADERRRFHRAMRAMRAVWAGGRNDNMTERKNPRKRKRSKALAWKRPPKAKVRRYGSARLPARRGIGKWIVAAVVGGGVLWWLSSRSKAHAAELPAASTAKAPALDPDAVLTPDWISTVKPAAKPAAKKKTTAKKAKPKTKAAAALHGLADLYEGA